MPSITPAVCCGTRFLLDSYGKITINQDDLEVCLQPLDTDRVKEWRHRRMLSQQEVADRAGTSLFTIQRIERGEGGVRPKTGRAVAAALGVPIEELLPKAQAPLFQESPEEARDEQRRVSYAALTAWAEYLELMLQRWRELETELRALLSRFLSASEERDSADLQLAVVRTREFFHGVWWVARTADYRLFKNTAFDVGQLEAHERETLRLIQARGERLYEISQHFMHFLDRLERAIDERLQLRQIVDEFLESARLSEESAEEVR
jgi:transcriptional regulator with XRE-family HTH domain